MNSPSCGWEGATMTSTSLAKELRKLVNVALPNQNKPKAKSRKGRKQRREDILGGKTEKGAMAVMRSTNVPVACEVTMSLTRRPTKRAFTHPLHGDGFEVEFVEPLANIVGAVASADLFLDVQGAVGSVNQINVSVDTIGGDLALEARTFDRYRIKSFELLYLPSAATTQAGTFSVGYVQDGAASAFQTFSYGAVQKMIPNGASPFYGTKPVRLLRYVNTNQLLTWYCESDPTSSASLRETIQGQIQGFPIANVGNTNTQGRLMITGICQLFQRTADFGFTLPRGLVRQVQLLGLTEHDCVDAVRQFADRRAMQSEADDVVEVKSTRSRR
jgi:hypothetical protein